MSGINTRNKIISIISSINTVVAAVGASKSSPKDSDQHYQ
jgi:hypothetical protein